MSKEQLDAASSALTARLQPFRRFPIGRTVYERICSLVREHRTECIARGIPYPVCAVVALGPPHNWLHIVRADCTPLEIQNLVRQIVYDFPTITGAKLVRAIMRAFPEYRGDVTISTERVVRSLTGEEGPLS